jgi:uncharacterized protein (DUF488 family)
LADRVPLALSGRDNAIRASGPGALPIYTVGHSTRTIEAFVDLLRAGQVELVVDIRSIPKSRRNPDYNLDELPAKLASYQLGHTHIAELGGLRAKMRTMPREVNAFWTNESFHNYADYALTETFQAGLSRLLDISSDKRCAIMCAEAVWWRCHRRLVADYLILHGRDVFHLLGEGRVEPAKMTSGATPAAGCLTYPAAIPPDASVNGASLSSG